MQRYSATVKDAVLSRYPLCRTQAEKEELARELGIGGIQKLYNLASNLGVSKPASRRDVDGWQEILVASPGPLTRPSALADRSS